MSGGIVWLTGIPASGKTTLGTALCEELRARGARAELLDGDELRLTLSTELGFSKEDREKQAARAAHVALLLARHGVWAVVALVSPYRDSRDRARGKAIRQGTPFFEVFVKCSEETARRRDPKGLYKRADAGEIKQLTGVSSVYDAPVAPEAVVRTDALPLADCVQIILKEAILPELTETPILIVGRGGSGTRLLAHLVRNLGVFLGSDIDDSENSLEVVDLVYWLTMETAGRPGRTPGEHRQTIRDGARRMLDQGKYAPGELWGWKLPETLYVLPDILDAFPKAKVIHLVRHPASAILGRPPHVTANTGTPLGKFLLPLAYQHAKRDPELIETDPHWLRGAISWDHQVSMTLKRCQEKLDPKAYLEVRYEDIVWKTGEVVQRVSSFLGARPIPWRPALDAGRINAPKPLDPDFAKLWTVCARTAAGFGYEGPPPEKPVEIVYPDETPPA